MSDGMSDSNKSDWFARGGQSKSEISDLRKACEALYVDVDGVPRCPLCQMPMNGEAESHLPDCQLRVLQESLEREFATGPLACEGTHTMFWNVLTENEKILLVQFMQSYANSLVAAAIEASAKCAEDDNEAHRSPDIAERIRSTVTPEAAAKELERIKNAARWGEHIKWCPYCIAGSPRCNEGNEMCVALEAAARKEK